MTDRFIGVGINEYKNAPLRGCVPDIKQCCDMLHELGWSWDTLRSCTDRRAIRPGIWRRLEWLVYGCKPGDRLLFWYSGHGVQIPERNNGEVDGLTEVLCPVDFNPDSRDTWLRDDDFILVLKKVPKGVNCTVVLDSCFSGGMVDLGRRKIEYKYGTILDETKPRAYPLEQNLDFDIRMKTAKERGLKAKPFLRTDLMPNVAFVLGCQENQTCADAYFDDGYRGALSYFLCSTIRENPQRSLQENVEVTKHKLDEAEFFQQPMIVGPEEIISKPFMARL